MADNDSDFSDDDDETPIAYTPTAAVTVKSVTETAPAPAPAPATQPAPTPVPSTPLASPHLVAAFPVHVTPPLVSSTLPGCGLALIYDPNGALPFTLTLYDARKIHLIHSPISYLASPSDLAKHVAPLSFTPISSASATLTDTSTRVWTLTWMRKEDGERMSIMLAIAQFITQVKCKDQRYVQSRFDLIRGTGHTCRPSSSVHLSLHTWIMDIAHSSCTSILSAISTPSFISCDAFHPNMDEPGYDMDVEVESEEQMILPVSLGQIIHKMKEGGQRLCVFPSTSAVAQSILTSQPQLASRAHHGALLIVHITAKTVNKKGKKDKTKEKKEKSLSSSSSSSSITTTTSKKQVSFDNAKPTSTTTPSSSSSISHLLLTDDTLSQLLTSLKHVVHDMNAHSTTQQQIFKHLVSGLYDGLRNDLDMIPPLEPQHEDGEEDAKYHTRVETWNQEIMTFKQNHPQLEQHLAALQLRLRGLLAQYNEKNGMDVRGTTTHVSTTWNTLLSHLQPLFEQGGLLTRVSMNIIRTTCDTPKVDVAMEQTLNETMEKNTQLTKQITELNNKQATLTSEQATMEEKIAKLTKERDELTQKTQMLTVFESGLVDMRKMLEKEMEEKQKYQKAFQDLNKLQKTLKTTWIPEKSVNECMQCQTKFGSGVFGKSKQYCRCCGRIFCKDCSTRTCPLPEFGYGSERVRVCNPCFEWRVKVNGEAAASRDEEEED